jgi:hypothetical protein
MKNFNNIFVSQPQPQVAPDQDSDTVTNYVFDVR